MGMGSVRVLAVSACRGTASLRPTKKEQAHCELQTSYNKVLANRQLVKHCQTGESPAAEPVLLQQTTDVKTSRPFEDFDT